MSQNMKVSCVSVKLKAKMWTHGTQIYRNGTNDSRDAVKKTV
jgi:hypothetical protein